MIARRSHVVYWLFLVLLLLLPLAACTTRASDTPPPARASRGASPAPRVARASATADAAVQAAVRFERAHCTWDWHQWQRAYLRAQQALATQAFARHLAAAADPVSWHHTVVAQHQEVSCTITDPHRVIGAPSTAARVYVRMVVAEHVTSTLGSFDPGTVTASWLVTRRDGRWRVAGSFIGG